MSIFAMVGIMIALATVFLFAVHYGASDKIQAIGLIATIIAILITMIGFIALMASRDTEITDVEVTESHTYQLVEMTIDGRGLYLVENDGKFQYSYIDDGKVEHSDVQTDQTTVSYAEGQAYVAYSLTTYNEHKEWWFLHQDHSRTARKYEFVVPSRECISYSFEK